MIGDVVQWLLTAEHWTGSDGLLYRVAQHVGYTLLAVLGACVIALPAGIWIGHTGRGGTLVIAFANAVRALPTLGLVTLFSLQMGVLRTEPVLLALILLAIPPVLAGAYAGVQSADRSMVDAASGVGMTRMQRLNKVEIPTALPLLIGGIRSAVLQVVATAVVAAYVGLGGLGRPLLDGLRVTDYPRVASAAIMVAALAIVLDQLLALVGRLVVPKGLRVTAATGAVR